MRRTNQHGSSYSQGEHPVYVFGFRDQSGGCSVRQSWVQMNLNWQNRCHFTHMFWSSHVGSKPTIGEAGLLPQLSPSPQFSERNCYFHLKNDIYNSLQDGPYKVLLMEFRLTQLFACIDFDEIWTSMGHSQAKALAKAY